MIISDAHCHFFSPGFFRALGRDLDTQGADPATALPSRLGWDAPGTDESLADRWVAELDTHRVSRALLIASVPGDAAAVGTAVGRHPDRLVGAFMVNPSAPDLDARLESAFNEHGLRMACLFPAMHGAPLDGPGTRQVFESAARHGRSVFVHCGVLSIGVRQKLGLPSVFDLRLGDPLAAAAVAARFPSVPVVIPHFGAGRFTEALMAASSAPNILFDTSSSNRWVAFHPGLTLAGVFARALEVVGPERLLFGTDSSFFPRGWQRGTYETQLATLQELGVGADAQALVFGGNFSRIHG